MGLQRRRRARRRHHGHPHLTPEQVGILATTWRAASPREHSTPSPPAPTARCGPGDSTSQGQLGDGTTTTRLSPVHIGSVTTWASIAAGGSHTLGTRTDGTLWAWGHNSSSELGDNTTTNRTSPARIGSATTWKQVSAGSSYSAAMPHRRHPVGLGDSTATANSATAPRVSRPVPNPDRNFHDLEQGSVAAAGHTIALHGADRPEPQAAGGLRSVERRGGAGGNRTLVRQAVTARATTIPESEPLRLAHRRVGGACAHRLVFPRSQWSCPPSVVFPTVNPHFCCRAVRIWPRVPLLVAVTLGLPD